MDQPAKQTEQPISKPPKPPKTHKDRIFGHIANVVIHAIMLYIAVNLLVWEAQFILPSWSEVLGVIKFSFWLNIAAYATFIIYDGRRYYYLLRVAMDVVSIYVGYRTVTVFPFDFNGFFELGWLNSVVPYLIWLGITGLAISIIVRTVRLITNKNIYI